MNIRGRRVFAVVFVLALIVCIALICLLCAPGRHDKPPACIVLISIDTCRADHLGCYGHAGKATPEIDRLAGHSTLMSFAYSPVPLTLPAHCSLLTGKVPAATGVHNNFCCVSLDMETLAERLSAEGYESMAVVSAVVLDSQFGLAQGFDTYSDRFLFPVAGELGKERRAKETTDLALEWLRNCKEEKRFLFVHYFDPHSPYDPPARFAVDHRGNPYLGEIAYVDSEIGRLLEGMREQVIYDDALIVLVADHGEMLGEKGEGEHSYFVYNSAVRVPMLIKKPGQREPRIVDDVVGLIDVTPTICALAEAAMPEGIQGTDLSPLLSAGSADPERSVLCESMIPTKYGANPYLAVVVGKWKLILSNDPELYDLSSDPGETRDAAKDHREITAALIEKAHRDFAAASEMAPGTVMSVVDPATQEKLESLSYVGGTIDTTVIDTNKANPRDMIACHELTRKISAAIRNRELAKALEMARAAARMYPDSSYVRILQGDILLQTDQPAASAAAYSNAVALSPGDSLPLTKRAYAYSQAGMMSNALADCDEAVALNPGEPAVWCARGMIRAKGGYTSEALADYTEGLSLNPRSAIAWALRGNLREHAGDAAGAELDYTEYLAIDSRVPEIWYSRAVVRRKQGNIEGAASDLQSCLRIAGMNWPHRARVKRLLDSLRKERP